MTPNEAYELQIEFFRNMTGQERLDLAFQMTAAWHSRAIQRIREKLPDASDEEVIRLLRERIESQKNRKS
jgi:hypothetical protein